MVGVSGIIDSRFRKRDKRSAFQKNLEKLRRTNALSPVVIMPLKYIPAGKKRGETIQSESESSSEEEDEDEENAAPFTGARPDNGAGDSNVEEDAEEEDTFIVEDDSAEVVDLPAEFSMGTYQDLLHHFKIVCQMFVHILVHDPDDRDEAAAKLRASEPTHLPLG